MSQQWRAEGQLSEHAAEERASEEQHPYCRRRGCSDATSVDTAHASDPLSGRQSGAGSVSWVRRRLAWRLAEVWRVLTDQVAAARLGERSVAALYAATRPEGARRVTYVRDEGLTRDQAIRDLQGLKAAGLIEEIGHGRTQRYIAAGAAAEAERTIRSARTSAPLRDPYTSNGN